MNPRLVGLLKLTLVALLMWFVFRSIHLEDRLVYVRGDETVKEQVIEIQGPWQNDPIRYTTADEDGERTAARGAQADGTSLDVESVRRDIAENWKRIRARSESSTPVGA